MLEAQFVISIIYVFPNLNPKVFEPMARRFTENYIKHPPGQPEHELFVIANGGGEITKRQEDLFAPLVPTFIHHNNVGRDIGAYQMAARHIPCGLMVCLGSHVRPRRAGWLDRIVQVYEDNGPALFGQWGFHSPSTHIRTTAFWLPPALLNAYPFEIDDAMRYQFEFGPKSITSWCLQQGFEALQVTWNGVFPADKFCHVNQEDALFIDRHCDNLGWKDE